MIDREALPERLRDTLELLDLMPERGDRIQALISFSDRFREVPDEIASRPFPEEHRVQGCESQAFVWMQPLAEGDSDGLTFHFAVENPQGVSAMSLAVILKEALDGQPATTAAAVPCDVVYEIYGRELSMGKSMGLMGMVNAVRSLARRHLEAR